jgi:hypothetical protein
MRNSDAIAVAFLIDRYVTHHTSGKRSAYAALGITSLPTDLAHLTHVAAYARNPTRPLTLLGIPT